MISDRQNEDRQIAKLAAQRELYSNAKAILGLQLFLTVPVAIVSALLVVFYPDAKAYVALWGIFVTISDLLILGPWQKQIRNLAAKIQEEFDCHVLDVPWNDLKVGKKVDLELIKNEADKHFLKNENVNLLKNWYSAVVDEVPIHIGRIACQRANCWWDAEQRRSYARGIIGFLAFFILILLVISLTGGFSVQDFILRVFIPAMPAILLGIRQYFEHSETAYRLDSLKDFSLNLWREAISSKLSPSELLQKSRNLQDEIFDHRKRSPLIFDFLYKKFRNKMEIQMNYSASELVEEAKKIGIVNNLEEIENKIINAEQLHRRGK